ncbi:MAG: C4-dicarboxylate TRAP transporter substrate-binding protein [Atribacterota bacterium]|nr:C4-dicarboxylate TRAP transporter substrate-binding protein [Atribacterota bacterium]MDD4895995.1 C4-dicarboxylate TRAP transporter substrate-binding protein [Atribacterota bacterium]MDD5637762.1 C4-dicarboxylate TRAP transporter substrate-binding protein [Atribacterota bacterium]
MKKINAVLLIVIALVVICSSLVSAQAKYVLKFNHVLSPNEPYHQGFLNWAERVKERTNGEVEIQVFHSAQLGVEEDIIEQIRQGVNVGQNTDSARLGNYISGIAVMNGPYFVNSIEEVKKLNEIPTIKKWNEELATEYGLKVLSFNWVQGFRHFMTNKPIKSPEDLKGLRIRTPPAPIWSESVRALGAVPTAINFGEIYTAVQQKAADGAELVYANIFGANLFEVLKYVCETKHFLLINFEVISAKWFDSLPEEYQKILVEECDKAGLETSYSMEEQIPDYRKRAEEKGMTIIPTEEINIEAFKEAGKAAYEVLGIANVREQILEELAAMQ